MSRLVVYYKGTVTTTGYLKKGPPLFQGLVQSMCTRSPDLGTDQIRQYPTGFSPGPMQPICTRLKPAPVLRRDGTTTEDRARSEPDRAPKLEKSQEESSWIKNR